MEARNTTAMMTKHTPLIDDVLDAPHLQTVQDVATEALAHVMQITMAHSSQQRVTLHVSSEAYTAHYDLYRDAVNSSPFVKIVIES